MPALNPSEYKNIQIGLINEGAVADSRMPLDAVRESLNFHFDRIGGATLRKGTTLLGESLGSGNTLGLYEFRDSGSGANNRIIMVNGSVLYYLSGGVWTQKRTGLTPANKSRFVTFLDYIFQVNGVDATQTWDGSASSSFGATNASGAPIGKFIEVYRSLVWISGNSTYPDRVYFSSVPSSVTTPVITWDTDVATGDWIDVSPSDGENITGLKRTKNALLVFKNNHIYRIYSSTESEPDAKIAVGTYSAESIVEAKDGIYFHHPSGFYKYVDNGVLELSRPIKDIVEAISVSNYSDICGWQDGDHVYWAIGEVILNGVTYSNSVVRYTISSQVWTHYIYPTQFLCAAPYNDGTTLFRLIGDNAGNVLKTDVGLTDNGTPISYSLEHRWHNFDGSLSTRKTINKILFAHKGGAGTNVQYQNEEMNRAEWRSIGQLKNLDTGFGAQQIRGRKIRFRISGNSVGEPFFYDGFDVLEGQNELITLT